jgi:four helix bundle protein
MQIALKEACETEYWLDILTETGYIGTKESESITKDCQELARLLHATVKTSKSTE